MYNQLVNSEEEKVKLSRKNLIYRQLQETEAYLIAQLEASQKLHEQHRQEMAEISVLFNPIGWAMVIRRYSRQLADIASANRATQTSTKERHKQAVITLDALIKRQTLFLKDAQRSDMLFMDRLSNLFEWSVDEDQRQHYRQALQSGYALVLTDITRTIIWVSHSFETMTGYGSAEVTGKNARFLQRDTPDPASIQHLRRHLDHTLDVKADLINYRKKGDVYLCHIHIKVLCNHAGKPTHFIAIENEVNAHR